jgi:hypothetical protein
VIAKIVFIFLAVIAVLGMFGKWRMPGKDALNAMKRKTLDARKCPKCGRYSIGKGPCDCGKRG